MFVGENLIGECKIELALKRWCLPAAHPTQLTGGLSMSRRWAGLPWCSSSTPAYQNAKLKTRRLLREFGIRWVRRRRGRGLVIYRSSCKGASCDTIWY